MRVSVTNTQRTLPVDVECIDRLARCVVRRLSIRHAGTLAIIFIDGRQMRQLNQRFLQHDRSTDVLSFRYEDPSARRGLARDSAPAWPTSGGLREAVVGEILIDPRHARRYAAHHVIPYKQELARYVIHGLLHWLGHDDNTPAQQRAIRAMEDRLLACCA